MAGFPSKVLVVDDESVILQILRQTFEAADLPAQFVSSGEEGEEVMQTTPFGCLLVDKNLRGLNGIDLMRRARLLQPHCAAIVMTGFASVESAIEALRLGAVDYVEKPFPSLEIVTSKVQQALRNAQARFEREALVEELLHFQAELSSRDDTLGEQLTEIEILNALVEGRVAQAVQDLKDRLQMISRQLAENKGGNRAARLSAEMVLDTARALERRQDSAPVRDEVARIVRQLEDHLTVLR